MLKRSVAAVLWFVTGWATVSMLAYMVDLSWWVAPIAGTLAAAFVLADPGHRLWRQPAAPPQASPQA
jgi:hypothetical protein